jgi:hypothetical protein
MFLRTKICILKSKMGCLYYSSKNYSWEKRLARHERIMLLDCEDEKGGFLQAGLKGDANFNARDT